MGKKVRIGMIMKGLEKKRLCGENREPMKTHCIVFYNHSPRNKRKNMIE